MNKYAEYKEAYKTMIKEAITSSFITRAALNSARKNGNEHALTKLYQMYGRGIDNKLYLADKFRGANSSAGTLTVPNLNKMLTQSDALPSPKNVVTSIANSSKINSLREKIGRQDHNNTNMRIAYLDLIGRLTNGM